MQRKLYLPATLEEVSECAQAMIDSPTAWAFFFPKNYNTCKEHSLHGKFYFNPNS